MIFLWLKILWYLIKLLFIIIITSSLIDCQLLFTQTNLIIVLTHQVVVMIDDRTWWSFSKTIRLAFWCFYSKWNCLSLLKLHQSTVLFEKKIVMWQNGITTTQTASLQREALANDCPRSSQKIKGNRGQQITENSLRHILFVILKAALKRILTMYVNFPWLNPK